MTAVMRSITRGVLCLLISFGATCVAAAETLSIEQREAILREAEAAYERGIEARGSGTSEAHDAFSEAASRYQQLLSGAPDNGHLQYNLGNVLFESGRLGDAILAYRRALAVQPDHAAARENLAYARTTCAVQIDPMPSMQARDAILQRTSFLSDTSWLFVASVAYVMFWGLLAWPGMAKRHWPVVIGVLIIVLGATMPLVARRWAHDGMRHEAVVLRSDLTVRKGHGDGFDPAFEPPLSVGVEVEIRDERGDWAQIRVGAGLEGWVPSAALGRVTGW